jgi:hypothetical protein
MEAEIQTMGKTPDVLTELSAIHQGLFGVMGMLRMVATYASKADDEALAVADVVEVMEQYVPIVEDMRVRLDAVIGQMR